MSEGRSGFRVFLGFLTGAAVGAGLALLFAPQTGEETRRKIKELSEKVSEDVKENMEKIAESAKSLVAEAKEKLKKKGAD